MVLFHRVDDRVKGSPLGCGNREFRAYCDFFSSHFEVVPLSEIVARLRSGRDLSNLLAITFDDGYRDNYLYAAPILRDFGLPACFFVATRFIGSDITPFWDRQYGVRSWWMTWDEVRALRDQGFEIGGHTRTHVNLGRIDHARAVSEIYGCREDLERELGEAPSLFSYPFGSPGHITEDTRELVRKAGFDCCFSAESGVTVSGSDPFRLKRFAVTPWHQSPMQFGVEMLLPEFRLGPPVSPRTSLELGIEVR